MALREPKRTSGKRILVFVAIGLSLALPLVVFIVLLVPLPSWLVDRYIDPDPNRYSRWRDPNPGKTSSTGLSCEDRTRLIHDLYRCQSRRWGAFVHGVLYLRSGEDGPWILVVGLIRESKDRLVHEAVADAADKHDFEAVRKVCRDILQVDPYIPGE